MKLDLFANRVHRAYFAGGMVRIEFGSVQPNSQGEVPSDGEIRPEDVSFTVTLPVNGFTRSVGALRNLYQELIQKGVLRKQEGGQGAGQPQQGGGQGRPQNRLQDLTADDDVGGGPLV
ncbi:hypothetical protein [Propylenella binzhouense]|uniref:Uncharacterized protein n=1 Tax=Propylenella binzhouense TaxID=2555902 RepID=A0A964T6D2_9HYPH|nr:hypothetical protein [Propylenella binzhouense]MYZ48955.1 hypothetical protein [Propylenella binzhouense]